MRIASLLLITGTYFVQCAAVAADKSGRALVDECYAYSEAGARECLTKNLRKSEHALKTAQDKAVGTLSKWDEDPRYITAAKQKLQTSNAAFEQYREAQCAFAYSLGGGAIGNALDMRRLACGIELNSKRTAEVSTAISTLPLKQPDPP
jgi:uncharacterized protein YecT (DUF1311 family)